MAESMQLIKEMAGLVALSEQRRERDKYEAELKEKMEKLLDDKSAAVWQEFEKRKPRAYEYDFEDEAGQDVTSVRKMIETPASLQKDKDFALDVQRFNDKVVAVSAITKRHPSTLNLWRQFKEGRSELKKALDTATSGKGAEWMPTQYSADFIERMEKEYKVASYFRHVTIPKGVDKLRIPGAGTAATIYKLSGSSDDDVSKITATTPGTRYVELDPVKLGARIEIETDMTEDSAVTVADFVNDELRLSAARALDDAIINADTASTHQDSDVTSDADVRKSWNGLRKLTSSSWKIDCSDTVNVANFRAAWAKMSNTISDYGSPEDLIVICNSIGLLKLLVLSETLTREKRGEKATVDTGQLNDIFGIDIVQSSRIRRDLNASGVYDGTTTDRTIIQFANKRAFVLGDKREVIVKSDENITTDRMRYVITMRVDYAALYESTEPIVAQIYNINVGT